MSDQVVAIQIAITTLGLVFAGSVFLLIAANALANAIVNAEKRVGKQ